MLGEGVVDLEQVPVAQRREAGGYRPGAEGLGKTPPTLLELSVARLQLPGPRGDAPLRGRWVRG